jgi:transposase
MQRVTCVRSYYETKSDRSAACLRRQFNVSREGRLPSRDTILAWVKKFEETGSVFTMKHGAPRTVRTPENLQRVREGFERRPRPSVHQHSHIL